MKSASSGEWVVNAASPRSRLDLQLSQLWKHRELAFFFAYRDVKVRYKQALLGAAWAVLQPLAGALILTVVFNRVADIKVENGSYFAFAVTGFVTWNYVSSAISSGTGSLLVNGDLLTKVSFPRLVIPVAAFMPGLIDLAIGLVVALVASLVAGGTLSLLGVLIGLPLGLVVLVLGVAGPVMFFSSAAVRYRDVLVLVAFGLQLMLFLTPIAYPPSLLSEGWRMVAHLNPVAGAVGLIRSGIIGAPLPTVPQIALSTVVALAVLLVSLMSFRSNERGFADII